MPLQHIHDRLLRLMSRRVNRHDTEELLARLRREIPGLVMRTTFIVGFPGETDAEFQELCDFVEQARFERVGVFEYSYEPDTPATRLAGHLPDDVKAERRGRLMEIQQEAAFEWSRQQIGRTLEVLIDSPAPDQDGVWLGRSYTDAPEIDGVTYVVGRKLRPGIFVPTKIVDAQGYDLVGKDART
jgi:ribosomal protein S12 methylthiotransferase